MRKTQNRSRSRSYGKKGPHQRFYRRKERAIERARVQEVETVEVVEKVSPTEPKKPWRVLRRKPVELRRKPVNKTHDGCGCGCVGTGFGLLGICMLLFGFPLAVFAIDQPRTTAGVVLLLLGFALLMAVISSTMDYDVSCSEYIKIALGLLACCLFLFGFQLVVSGDQSFITAGLVLFLLGSVLLIGVISSIIDSISRR